MLKRMLACDHVTPAWPVVPTGCVSHHTQGQNVGSSAAFQLPDEAAKGLGKEGKWLRLLIK